MIVAVLGLASYGLSFGPVVDGGGANGWNVRFAALAALGAGFALLPTQKPHVFAVAALAAMGFLDALSSSVLATNGGWPLTVIAVLNGVQATAAVAALVRWRATSPAGYAGYEAYVDYYNQLAQYYRVAQAPAPQSAQQFGYAQYSAEQRASASDEASAQGQVSAQQRPAAPSQVGPMAPHGDYADLSDAMSPATHGGYGSSQHEYGEPASGAHTAEPQGGFGPGTGLPSAARTSAPAGAPGEGIRRNPPRTASP